MFMGEMAENLNQIVCRYFAVAPEFDPKDYQPMNKGVMLMNLKNLIAMDESFRRFVMNKSGKISFLGPNRLQWFYRRLRKFFYRHRWDRLPVELTGSLTGGDYSRAKIVHFQWSEAVSKTTC